MRSTVLVAGLLCFLPLGVAWGQGAAAPSAEIVNAKPVGKVMTVSGVATIEHASTVVLQAKLSHGGAQPAKLGDPIYQNDVIQTALDAAVGIVFTDGTSFNMSKNARMEINEYIYDPKGPSNSTLFSLTRGTFTFIAGKAANTGNMRVETPVGTMGIRGTAPHVEITDDGRVKFATLVEENKRQTQATVRSSPANNPSSSALEKADRRLNGIMNICRGC
jgi:hypothetical protein